MIDVKPQRYKIGIELDRARLAGTHIDDVMIVHVTIQASRTCDALVVAALITYYLIIDVPQH